VWNISGIFASLLAEYLSFLHYMGAHQKYVGSETFQDKKILVRKKKLK